MKILNKISLAACLLTFLTDVLVADDWSPPGPITMQIAFGAGGETDTVARVLAHELQEQTGWKVVAANKPGGGGIAMFSGISTGPTDGTVIGVGVSMPVTINLVLRGDKLPFDIDSFDYLGTIGRGQVAVVSQKGAPFDDIAGLIAYSKSTGGAAVAFDAKPQEMILRFINQQDNAGLKPVSTKSGAETLQYILGGHVIASFSAGKHVPYLENGKLKMIASANYDRHNYAPHVLSIREQGFDVYVNPYIYIAARSGLEMKAREALLKVLDQAIKSESVKQVVENTLQSSVDNLGQEGTKQMMLDGVESAKVLFGKN